MKPINRSIVIEDCVRDIAEQWLLSGRQPFSVSVRNDLRRVLAINLPDGTDSEPEEEQITCKLCDYSGPLDDYWVVSSCKGCLFCPGCATEINSDGTPHICDVYSEGCRETAKGLGLTGEGFMDMVVRQQVNARSFFRLSIPDHKKKKG